VLAGFLVQLAIILAVAHVFGALFSRLGQPRVCGEIAAGLVLGPSLLGRMSPAAHATLFPASAAPTLKTLSELGLLLLMFLVGLNLHVDQLLARKRAASAISMVGIVVPFVLGLGLAEILYRTLGLTVDARGFRLFVATAVSITAIPTLARIIEDLGLQHTRVAALVTTAAALDDVVGWSLLASITALMQSRFDASGALLRLSVAGAFGCTLVCVVRRLVQRWGAQIRDHLFDGSLPLAAALVTILLGAAFTTALGLSGIFGAFVVGVGAGGDPRLRQALARDLQPVALTLLLPVFFTYTGMRTDIGSLHGAVPWLLCALVVAVAILGKLAACAAAASTMGVSGRDAWAVGILMNTRGLMELVVVNIGLDLGVIPHSVFFMLVLMAVITTYMTTPLLRRALRDSDLAPSFAGSAFAPVR
jgi:Kef-type K+ transport system membrane component KefB